MVAKNLFFTFSAMLSGKLMQKFNPKKCVAARIVIVDAVPSGRILARFSEKSDLS